MTGFQCLPDFRQTLAICLLLYALQGPIRGSPPVLVNGILGESVVLPSGLDERLYSSVSPDLMQWERDGRTVIQLINNKTVETNLFRGRVSLSTEDGSLTISSLKAEDRGNYMFSGGGSSGQFPGKSVTLHVYERIRSVQIQSQRSYGTDNKTCHLTLNCTVTGGSQVDLIWLKGKNKNPEETKQSVLQLTVKPTDDDYSYTCVASNPVSNQSDTIEGNECYTQGPSVFHVSMGCLLKSVLFSVGLLVMLSAVIAVHFWETLRHRKKKQTEKLGKTGE
ncbi:SLAM family member 5 [Amia ocellicauda]|uniref:SLAM family member 5 n=1 Tax=Amia ocellicauda TaxID=2972642 RepID=UPI0034642336